MKRIIFDVLLFLSVFILPWWISAFLLLIGIFAFDNFYEFIVATMIVYSLYAPQSDRLISSPIFISLIVVILYVVIHLIRNNLILYRK